VIRTVYEASLVLVQQLGQQFTGPSAPPRAEPRPFTSAGASHLSPTMEIDWESRAWCLFWRAY